MNIIRKEKSSKNALVVCYETNEINSIAKFLKDNLAKIVRKT